MNRIEEIRRQLVGRGIVSATGADELSFSLSTGDLADTRRRLSRRFRVSKRGAPFLSVRLLPKPWPFSPAEIAATYERYGSFEAFKVPHLLDHFDGTDCDYFVEEFIPSAVSLDQLVQSGDVSAEEAANVVRQILLAVWDSGEPPTSEFIEEQTSMIRRSFADFFHSGAFGAFLVDSVEKSFAASQTPWRRVLSSGDIIGRNILRAGDSWYLVDFEHSHSTLYFFKEACRSRMYNAWARDLPLASLCPFVADIPEESLELISLACEAHLCETLLEPGTLEAEQERLRVRLWDILDAHFAERLDTRLRDADDLRSKQVALRDEMAKLEKRIATQDSDARRAASEQLSLRADLEVANQRYRAEQGERVDAQRLLQASREEVSGLRSALVANRAEHQASLRTQTESFHAKLEQQTSVHRARERQIEEIFRAELEQQASVHQARERQTDESFRAELEQQASVLQARERQIEENFRAELEQQASVLQARERQIDEICRSRAWRITLPLRWLSARLRRVFAAADGP